MEEHLTFNQGVGGSIPPYPTYQNAPSGVIARRQEVGSMADLPVIDMTGTGENIERLRKQAGLSVRDLQDIFGFATPQAIYKWQQGVSLPAVENLAALAAVFQVRIDDILVINSQL